MSTLPTHPAGKQAMEWARTALHEKFVILDFETTGLRDSFIVQLAAIDGTGQTLIDTYINPGIRIPPGASAVHGIRDSDVRDAPTFKDLYVSISAQLAGAHVIAYNADFEKGILSSEYKRLKLPPIRVRQWSCAMKTYAAYRGQRSSRGDYKWHKLGMACQQQGIRVSDAHSALGDCHMTLALLRAMAGQPPDPSP